MQKKYILKVDTKLSAKICIYTSICKKKNTYKTNCLLDYFCVSKYNIQMLKYCSVN